MKNIILFKYLHLRFQVGHISPKKIGLVEEFDDNPTYTNLYIILIKHREIKLISDGNNIISAEVV